LHGLPHNCIRECNFLSSVGGHNFSALICSGNAAAVVYQGLAWCDGEIRRDSTVLQLRIGSVASCAPIEELKQQVHDYVSLISDPACPAEMRELLILEMGQIVTALLIMCERLECAVLKTWQP